MKNNIPLYKLAPVTASTAEFLAKVYGASSIEDYTKSLPRSAHILDVGAGNSELGRVITSLRPDIVWTNLDISYTPTELSRLKQEALKNLKYLNGDILDSHSLPKNSYDRIYAFWILPHIGLEDPALIRTGIVNMLNLLKNNQTSRLVIGPLMNKRTGHASTGYLTAELGKGISEKNLNDAATDCTAPKDKADSLRAMNRAGLTTLKNGQRTGQKPTKLGLWDIQRGQYVRAFSIRGLLLMTRFRIYLAIEKVGLYENR